MPSKKKTTTERRKQSKHTAKLSPTAPEWTLGLANKRAGSNGLSEYQHIKNPQSGEEREKWLEKRDELTLRAFQIAYENHRRKAS